MNSQSTCPVPTIPLKMSLNGLLVGGAKDRKPSVGLPPLIQGVVSRLNSILCGALRW